MENQNLCNQGSTHDENDNLVLPTQETITIDHVKFSYYIEPKPREDGGRFLSRDIFSVLEATNPDIEEILIISDVNVEDKKADVTGALEVFARSMSEKYKVIAIQLHIYADNEIDANVYWNTTLIELAIDLDEAGFVEINSLCQFEESIPFVYRNKYTKEFFRFVTRLALRDFSMAGVEFEFKDHAQAMYHFDLPSKFDVEAYRKLKAKEDATSSDDN